MNRESGSKGCQIQTVPQMSEPLSPLAELWQGRNRCRRIFKRRYNYLLNMMWRKTVKVPATGLEAGDWVRVKSQEEIGSTLNNWNQLRHCAFMEEMAIYCGTRQRVLKRVRRFLDERDYLMKKCSGIVLLEGVFCEGTVDFGPCDRTCHFFWREEWLEKIPAGEVPERPE